MSYDATNPPLAFLQLLTDLPTLQYGDLPFSYEHIHLAGCTVNNRQLLNSPVDILNTQFLDFKTI